MVLGLALIALISGFVLSTIFVALHKPTIKVNRSDVRNQRLMLDEIIGKKFRESYGA
jgi:hypothetical protein